MFVDKSYCIQPDTQTGAEIHTATEMQLNGPWRPSGADVLFPGSAGGISEWPS